ncbi:hypothetical protein [Luteipulveratus mongoliensis]|uniref:Uncharacterized protein n=1 Tax=Luteipulveratus mongoliensis TaxID=571913 RepID=A0A0K1JMH0_9MICO|nr:hypothetical protein [Luteipulveratus mongoliensis]AKU17911.1 hypothetical protein VV02_22020 [Luteipulveratus mongoliensis]
MGVLIIVLLCLAAFVGMVVLIGRRGGASGGEPTVKDGMAHGDNAGEAARPGAQSHSRHTPGNFGGGTSI